MIHFSFNFTFSWWIILSPLRGSCPAREPRSLQSVCFILLSLLTFQVSMSHRVHVSPLLYFSATYLEIQLFICCSSSLWKKRWVPVACVWQSCKYLWNNTVQYVTQILIKHLVRYIYPALILTICYEEWPYLYCTH